MSPNAPKTPITSFRLSDETREGLAKLAEHYSTNMTGALRRLTAAMAPLAEYVREQAATYPIEALHAAGMAYRDAMGYEAGHRLTGQEYDALNEVLIASNPIIRAEQERKTLDDVIVRLEGFSVDPAIVEHFRNLRDA